MNTTTLPDRFDFKARAFARHHGYTDKPEMIVAAATVMRETYRANRLAFRSPQASPASDPLRSGERLPKGPSNSSSVSSGGEK